MTNHTSWEEEFDKEFKDDLESDNPWKYAHPYLKQFISKAIYKAKEEKEKEVIKKIKQLMMEGVPGDLREGTGYIRFYENLMRRLTNTNQQR